MILGHVGDPTTYQSLVKMLPVLQDALTWIQGEGRTKPPGEYPIFGGMRAIVQEISTQLSSQCHFESHEDNVDVQYCLEGGETVGWAPRSTLSPINEYNPEKDVRHYYSPAMWTELRLKPGMFAIFFPEDAHMPKVWDSKNPTVRKVVVKVPIDLLTR